ncbi:MAG: terminase small subunit [Candidatus Paceibacterota bacterium]|jgi:hypothetical protein
MLTAKQEKFVLNVLSGMSQSEAYRKAGYACKNVAVVTNNASRLARKDCILKRITELRGQVASDKILTVTQRKEILSEIARAKLTDYQEAGADGAGYINIGKESPNIAAIAGIESATKFDENGNTGMLFTKVKLHNPVQAIAELNKMEKIYSDAPTIINNTEIVFLIGKGYVEKASGVNLLEGVNAKQG